MAVECKGASSRQLVEGGAEAAKKMRSNEHLTACGNLKRVAKVGKECGKYDVYEKYYWAAWRKARHPVSQGTASH